MARRLAEEQLSHDPIEERARHSVFDEPAVLPNRPSVLIERDWSCRSCGYNLRGLMTGHRCPECGCVEMYEPPRDGELTYAQWLERRRDPGSRYTPWVVAGTVPLLALPFAVFSGMFSVEHFLFVNFVILAPVMSEVLKIAIPAVLIERRTSMVNRPGQIYLMALGTAVIFTIVQNVIYFALYYKNPAAVLMAYRWFICVFLHSLCTGIAAYGLSCIWEKSQREERSLGITKASPYIVAAIVVHGTFNACVFALGFAGYGF